MVGSMRPSVADRLVNGAGFIGPLPLGGAGPKNLFETKKKEGVVS